MATQVWPEELPIGPSMYSEAEPDANVIRTQPDNGPAKMRRRFTKSTTQGSMGFTLTIEQYQIFREFFKTNLNMGTERFSFWHPWDRTMRDYRITNSPKYAAEGTLAVTVEFTWELF